MFQCSFSEIPYVEIISVFVGFSFVLMLKETVIKLMTFVKGLNLE